MTERNGGRERERNVESERNGERTARREKKKQIEADNAEKENVVR